MKQWMALFSIIVAGACCEGCNKSPAKAPVATNSAATSVAAEVNDSAKPDTIKDTSFDDIKFEIEPDAAFEKSMLTPKINDLFGRRIRIRGYIYPTLKKRGLKQFVLVRDNLECCFGPGAALYDCILVHMNEGKTAEFSIRPVAVEGEFVFEEFPDYDGTTRAIYRLNGESVE